MNPISMQVSAQSAPSQSLQSLCFPHRAFAAISGCGDWVKEKHVQQVISKVLPSISTSDFSVQLLPYPDNPSKVKSTIVSFASKSHFDGLLAQRPCSSLSIQAGLHPLRFSPLRADSVPRSSSKARSSAPCNRQSSTVGLHPPSHPPSATPAAAAPEQLSAACLPATVAPWAAVASETADNVVRLVEVMKEQEEEEEKEQEQEGRHWQVVQQKKIQKDVPATPSPSEFKLYAYLLPLSVSRANIITHFGERVHITGPFPSSGVAQGKAHCWLGCSDKHECDRVLKLNNSVMMEHQIRVEHARSKRAAASVEDKQQAVAASVEDKQQAVAASVEDKQQAVECGAVAHSRVPAAAAAAAAAAAPAAPAAADDDTSKWFALCDAADADIGQSSCSICQESDCDGSNAVRLLCVCKQTFHKSCIQQWFQSHASCPNCRYNFTAPQLPPAQRSFESFFNAPVQVSPHWQGAPSTSWVDMPAVADAVLDNLQDAGYDVRPLPIQQHACPIIASGSSLLATAETGSGKTAAYLVPIISRIHHQRQSSSAAAPRARSDEVKLPAAVIIAPTHELVEQIAKAAERLARGTCVRVSVVSGNLDSKQQRQQLNKGCDLLVASRGRALQLMQEGTVGLERTETLCFDEADVLLQGEGPQQIDCMLALCPPNVQVLMFSATFHPERRDIALNQLLPEDVVMLQVGRVGCITENVDQNFFLAETEEDKLKFLEHIMKRKQQYPSKGGTIIFVNTRKNVDFLVKHLISRSIAATGIHGDLVPDERRDNMKLFTKGHCEVLVATGAFGRGLDLPFVTHVINFDFPNNRDAYTQQCGRAGRGGALGEATTIVPSTKSKHTSGQFFAEIYQLACALV